MSRLVNAGPLVCLITDGSVRDGDFNDSCDRLLPTIRAAVENRIPLVQIREKAITPANLYRLAERAASMCSRSFTRLIVNDRADIAAAAGADGVHLTASSMPVSAVRLGFPGLLVGFSAHSVSEVGGAKADGADYAFLSPVFESPGKGAPVGIGELGRAAVLAADFPVLGLGGIDATNYGQVMEAVGGFAAIRFLNDVGNLERIGAKYYGRS